MLLKLEVSCKLLLSSLCCWWYYCTWTGNWLPLRFTENSKGMINVQVFDNYCSSVVELNQHYKVDRTPYEWELCLCHVGHANYDYEADFFFCYQISFRLMNNKHSSSGQFESLWCPSWCQSTIKCLAFIENYWVMVGKKKINKRKKKMNWEIELCLPYQHHSTFTFPPPSSSRTHRQ